VVWLAYVLQGREFDAEFVADIRGLFTALYHVDPSQEQLRRLIALE
jgi:hypothetical protein